MNVNIVELAVLMIFVNNRNIRYFYITLKLFQVSQNIIYTHHHVKNKVLLYSLVVPRASASP